MRDAVIYIPTRGRVHKQTTWAALSPAWRARTFTVTDETEAAPLRKLGHHVLVAPMLGLAERRQWILDQHDVDLLGEVLIQMDDDLNFAIRRTDDPGKFRQLHQPVDAPVFDRMMDLLVEQSEFSPMGGIQDKSGAFLDPEKPYHMNRRMFDVLMYDVLVARQERIQMDRAMLEDFDVILQFLSLGYPTLSLNTHWKGSIGGAGAAGGCAIYRDNAWQTKAATQLAELWPDFVTVVERAAFQGSKSKEPRKDVRITWAKAAKAGREGRELLGLPQHPTIDWSTGSLRFLP